jgi:hypothetical protein
MKGRRGRKPNDSGPTWKKGQRVAVEFGDDLYPGTIVRKPTSRSARVDFDDGESLTIALSDLRPPELVEDLPPAEPMIGAGFTQYTIDWVDDAKTFKVKTPIEGVNFEGHWRRTQDMRSGVEVFAVDLYAHRNGRVFAVQSIPYRGDDPLGDILSLNADICAAINQWLYCRCAGNVETLDDLERRAAHPLVHISRVESIDRAIIRLREVRDTALRAGGRRCVTIEGDRSGDPPLVIELDLSSQAIAMGGKVPPPMFGGALDGVTKGSAPTATKEQASEENVLALVDKLEQTKDKSQARKLRAILRKMGHRGGARAIRAKMKAKEEEGN